MRRSRRRVGIRSFLPQALATATPRALLPLLALAGSLAQAVPALAQDPQQKAAAEALFDEARQLLSQGQYETACRKFEQSEEIDPGVGVLLYLGECYERSGRLASAWAIFREANSRAEAAGQTERAKIAEDRARRLSTGLSKLILLVPQNNRLPGFELLLNGRPISPALYGVPFPVDAGQHEITARAPGRQAWSNIVEVKANADFRNVQIPPLGESHEPAAASPAPTPSTSSGAAPSTSGEFTATLPPPGPRPDLTPVYLLGGIGIVAIGVGAVFGVRAADKDDDAKAQCPSDCLSPQAANMNEAARTSALVANISYGVGAAALLTSAYLYLTAGSGSESTAHQPPGLQVGGTMGRQGGFVSVSGNF